MHYTPRKGLNVPTITAVDDAGRVVEVDQRRVFRHVIQDGFGADSIFANGTTGEWNRLDNRERQRVMEIAVDEVRGVNAELFTQGRMPVEVWAGVNGSTRREVLDNLDAAIQLGADAAVVAPLAVTDLDEQDIVRFFRRELNERIERAPQPLPVFLYDNADINAPGRTPHIRTRVVKELSRLPWVSGIKVSAPRRVLGNYTKAALHFKQPGEWGIYVGNAGLIFDWFKPKHGFVGRVREGWRDWLLNDHLPIGVVSGPANVLPREWQKAWRVCWAGDGELIEKYERLCADFEDRCVFQEGGQSVTKMLACLKYALELDGVISSSAVCRGTPALTEEQRTCFREGRRSYPAWADEWKRETPELWRTATQKEVCSPSPSRMAISTGE
jgi:dihydrodipicolinate synthase/N-acetylneuraminate lyase